MWIEWNEYDASHMWESHTVTPAEANAAAEDPDAIWFDPDPASKSGISIRVIGYSNIAHDDHCIILIRTGHDTYRGVNGWPANNTYKRRYREGA